MANSEDEAFENSLKELEVTDPDRATAARWLRAKRAESQKDARRAEEALRSYKIAWDGETVTIPAAGKLNPDGVSWTRIYCEPCLIRHYLPSFVLSAATICATSTGQEIHPSATKFTP